MLNCKQGDLAIVVRSLAGNEGKVVRCLRLADDHTWDWIEPGARWRIDPPLPSMRGPLVSSAADCCLRPLREADGEDEMLRIAGRPRTVCTPNVDVTGAPRNEQE